MWYEQERWKDRLVVEREIMRQRFPGFVLVRDRDRNLAWHGTVEPTPGYRFEISLSYPPNYPYGEPKAKVRTPEVRTGAPHVYADGTLCIHRERWNPERGTAAGHAALISGWLLAYVDWLKTQERY